VRQLDFVEPAIERRINVNHLTKADIKARSLLLVPRNGEGSVLNLKVRQVRIE
jgi:hypothetical protein